MTPNPRCEQLLLPDVSEALLRDAADAPECLEFILSAAQEQLGINPEEAIRRALTGIKLARWQEDERSEALCWRIIGQAERVQGNHAAAIDTLRMASNCAAGVGEFLLAAQVQIGRIDSLGWLGRFEEAHRLAQSLEETFRAMGLPGEAAKVLVNRGALHYRRDQYAPAIACNEAAIALMAESGDLIAQAKVQSNLAAVFMELHRADEAAALFERARAAFLAGNLPIAAAMVEANIGFLHYLSGRHAQCVAAFQKAREEFSRSGLLLETAKCDADMAEAYHEMNLYPEALETYARAIDAPESLPLDYERARAERGRAAALFATGQTADALAGLERASALFRRQRNTAQLARVRLQQAHILRQTGQTDLARAEARRAQGALRRSGLRGWAAEASFLLAELNSELGRDAARSLHHIRRTAKETARGWLECRAERALAQHFTRRENPVRALRHLRASAEALEQARTLIAPESMHIAFLSDKMAVYEDVVAALLARGKRRDIAEALEYVERAKSRLLLERLESALESRFTANAIPLPIQERLAALRAELSQGYFRLNAVDESEARRVGATDAADRKALTALEQEYCSALQQAEWSADAQEAVSALPPVVPVKTLQACLYDNETLLEYYITGETVCAWIVTAQGVRIHSRLARVEDVTFAARRLRYQLQQKHGGGEFAARQAARFQSGAEDALRSLYDLLLRPLAEELATEKIILVPHGVLHGLPFHAFYDGASPALERWEFVTSPSAAIWHSRARRRSENDAASGRNALGTALLMGVASPELPHVAAELARLKDILPNSRIFQQADATLAAFHANAPDCRLLHIAAHALYREDNPLFSGLQCADGWLLARDLYDMKLTCELAALSACQTGVAFVQAGDELFGLARGFLAAGARAVAASLWPADDEATACLMAHFYTNWMAGATKAAALRTAQRQMRLVYPHPYHWAAFILIGEN